ncbi:hypothetical protein LXL04_034334 [Taraxacum kok-saghyz]
MSESLEGKSSEKKMKKATGNKKKRDRELSEPKAKEMAFSDSQLNENNNGGMSDKKNKLKKKKRNSENKEDSVHENVTHDNADLDGVKSSKKTKKVAKSKKRKSTETPEAILTNIAVCPSPDDVKMSDKKKSKLKKKKNNKQKRKKDDVDENLLHSNESGANSNHQIDKSQSTSKATSLDDEDEVYQISSGDEDETTGMKRWISEYHGSRPGAEVLLQRINDFLVDYWAQKEKERKERESEAAEGGWTVVTHMKGRKKTTDAESGTTVGSVAQAAVMDKMSKKKDNQIGLNFYRFQKREAQRNEIMMLQSKFEQDKKRIQQLRAARKFRPY